MAIAVAQIPQYLSRTRLLSCDIVGVECAARPLKPAMQGFNLDVHAYKWVRPLDDDETMWVPLRYVAYYQYAQRCNERFFIFCNENDALYYNSYKSFSPALRALLRKYYGESLHVFKIQDSLYRIGFCTIEEVKAKGNKGASLMGVFAKIKKSTGVLYGDTIVSSVEVVDIKAAVNPVVFTDSTPAANFIKKQFISAFIQNGYKVELVDPAEVYSMEYPKTPRKTRNAKKIIHNTFQNNLHLLCNLMNTL